MNTHEIHGAISELLDKYRRRGERIEALEAELIREKQMYAAAVENSQLLEALLSPVTDGTHKIVPVNSNAK